MSLTNPNFVIDTTFSTKNISSAASVYSWTVTTSAKVQFLVKITVAGNGDYVAYLTHQWLGSGTAAVILPKTTGTAASGETVIEFVTIPMYAKATDVFNVMVDGLAGDTSVSGNIRIVSENFSVFDASADNIINATLTKLDTALVQDGAVYQYTANALENGPSSTATVAISATDAQRVNTGRLAITTSHSFSQAITSTLAVDLSTAKIWWAVKRNPKDDADSASLIFVDNATGLIYLYGSTTPTAGWASIVVTGSTGAWVVTLNLDEEATDLLRDLTPESYASEVKYRLTGDDLPVWSGWADITAGVVRDLV